MAKAVEILYPFDRAWIRQSNIFVIKASPEAESLVLAVNGQRTEPIAIDSETYQETFGDYLVVKPEYDPGRNILEVWALAQESVLAEDTIEIYYDPFRPPGDGNYVREVMHRPEREARCVACHDMAISGDLGQRSEEELCASCHARKLTGRIQHSPAREYRCFMCHDSQGGAPRYGLKRSERELCETCHTETVANIGSVSYAHAPFSEGGCSVCHDPHGSNVPGLLKRPVNELCLECHKGVERRVHVVQVSRDRGHPLSGYPNPLAPESELSCISCHLPHGGDSPSFLAAGARSGYELCMKCHPK